MKKWIVPVIEELQITETANALAPQDGVDGPWVQIDGVWMSPGNGSVTV